MQAKWQWLSVKNEDRVRAIFTADAETPVRAQSSGIAAKKIRSPQQDTLIYLGLLLSVAFFALAISVSYGFHMAIDLESFALLVSNDFINSAMPVFISFLLLLVIFLVPLAFVFMIMLFVMELFVRFLRFVVRKIRKSFPPENREAERKSKISGFIRSVISMLPFGLLGIGLFFFLDFYASYLGTLFIFSSPINGGINVIYLFFCLMFRGVFIVMVVALIVSFVTSKNTSEDFVRFLSTGVAILAIFSGLFSAMLYGYSDFMTRWTNVLEINEGDEKACSYAVENSVLKNPDCVLRVYEKGIFFLDKGGDMLVFSGDDNELRLEYNTPEKVPMIWMNVVGSFVYEQILTGVSVEIFEGVFHNAAEDRVSKSIEIYERVPNGFRVISVDDAKKLKEYWRAQP